MDRTKKQSEKRDTKKRKTIEADLAYWMTKTPEEKIIAVEALRRKRWMASSQSAKGDKQFEHVERMAKIRKMRKVSSRSK